MKPPRMSLATPAPPRRPLVIAVVNQKGGVGKSMVAACLADLFLLLGWDLLCVDGDPQHTLMRWGNTRGERGLRAPRIIDAAMPDQKAGEFPGHDVVIIDCPGRLDDVLKSALLVADVAIVPIIPLPFDLWALKGTVDLVSDAQAVRPELDLAIVLNAVSRATVTRVTAAAIRAAGAKAKKTVCTAELGRRMSYPMTTGAGGGPCSLEPDGVAAGEMRALFDEITTLGRARCESSQPMISASI